MLKNKLFNIITIMLTITMILCSCGQQAKSQPAQEEDPTTKNYENGIVYDEEMEDAKLEFKKVKIDKFYGEWEAKSGDAHYLFGNIDLDIKEDGTWTGNIADEKMKGTWAVKGDGIIIKNKWIKAKMLYTKEDVLIFQQLSSGEDDEDIFNTVLTRK